MERLGKYTKTLTSGLSIVVPYLDKVAYKISILERRLEEFDISVITRDNVEFGVDYSLFF